MKRSVSAMLKYGIGVCLFSGVVASSAFAQTPTVQLDTINVEATTVSAYGPVQGYNAKQSATGTKTDTPLRETPQSISVVTADRMKDQGVTTVQEAVRYVPGVMADSYGPDSRVDSLTIRGMEPSIYLDGMRTTNSWWNSQRLDPYALERTEVLRGPSSVLYGSTTTAGLVNLVSKRPQAKELTSSACNTAASIASRSRPTTPASFPPTESGSIA